MNDQDPRLLHAVRTAYALLLLVGCGSERVDLIVDMESDFLPDDVVEVRVSISQDDVIVAGSEYLVLPTDDLTALRLGRFSVAKGTYEVRVEAGRGTIVAAQSTTIRVDRDTAVTLQLERVCLGVQCPGELDPASWDTCRGGRCVPPGTPCTDCVDASIDAGTDVGMTEAGADVPDSASMDSDVEEDAAPTCSECGVPVCTELQGTIDGGEISLGHAEALADVSICHRPCGAGEMVCSMNVEFVGAGGPDFRWRSMDLAPLSGCHEVQLRTEPDEIVSRCALDFP